MLDREVEISFTHPQKNVCRITAYLSNDDAEIRFALNVPMARFRDVLEYLNGEVGRTFTVQGDEVDAQEAEVTLHDD